MVISPEEELCCAWLRSAQGAAGIHWPETPQLVCACAQIPIGQLIHDMAAVAQGGRQAATDAATCLSWQKAARAVRGMLMRPDELIKYDPDANNCQVVLLAPALEPCARGQVPWFPCDRQAGEAAT
ncbi:unnamed protein product [Ostreobium quekettii]|uniref:Uncharacterized protein n=1 Tax=Ostreobium quekettii TaxID=121088 RepID=A0A8S1IRX3_9CHLO|nr:unnamed protein product [Ostreobium quekettii]